MYVKIKILKLEDLNADIRNEMIYQLSIFFITININIDNNKN